MYIAGEVSALISMLGYLCMIVGIVCRHTITLETILGQRLVVVELQACELCLMIA